jgi:hypothetical protein
MLCPNEIFFIPVLINKNKFGFQVWALIGFSGLSVNEGGGMDMQGFRRTAASNNPAGIRCLVYGMQKGKVLIEGFMRVGPS